jgi:uncharacterized protein
MAERESRCVPPGARPNLGRMDRQKPSVRPPGKPAGYHEWRTLLFLHWEVPVEALRPLIPERLSIDTFEGKAYVGLVPFTMRGVRPRWLPALPGISAFHETNVRTYVHLEGDDPGVWFFSLDAANLPAVIGARTGWNLQYHFAKMRLEQRGDTVEYSSVRRTPGPTPAELEITWTIGAPREPAEPATLDHFLVERYFLYAQRGETLFRGQVHHRPYPLRLATVGQLRESLIAAAKIPISGPPMSVLYSPGVDVEVFPLIKV